VEEKEKRFWLLEATEEGFLDPGGERERLLARERGRESFLVCGREI
jgi:hypothetical protein